MTTGIAGLGPSYGGFAATPGAEAQVLARRFNPFLYLQTGQGGPMQPTEPLADPGGGAGYAAGGMIADAGNAASLLDLLLTLGDHKRSNQGFATGSSSGDTRGAGDGTNAGGSSSGAASSANYGPTSLGMSGISPGRSTLGNLAGFVAAQAIPGAGLVGSIGQGFNAAAKSMALGQGIANMLGQDEPGLLGNLSNGLFGVSNKDFNQTALGLGLNPDTAMQQQSQLGSKLSGVPTTAAMASQLAAAQAAIAAATPGLGIIGTAGPAATGAMPGVGIGDVTGTNMAMGFAGTPAMGNDGVVGTTGSTPGDFGQMTGAGETSGQGGSGANGPGGANNGGSAGGAGANGTGGDNAGGWARGGVIRAPGPDFFAKRLAKGSGLVHGLSDGRSDRISMAVPRGSYVVPADVVSGLGQGNTLAGGRKLAGTMAGLPKSPGLRFAQGGIAGTGSHPPVDIQVSAGEFVVHPDHVAALGGGDPQAGAGMLDRMVQGARQQAVANTQAMPPPR